ncbi:hypothetical protein JDFR1000234_66 [uncultured archaeal virus]|uniref:Uncharacterized protein n=1 Tax=uncultured archaeal virus TaxID=1960247 RepID=A0A1S5Y354_9VIRU|nr:hypothetical protein JDFR1000234_66 [uncultured archaeal virus]
MVKVDLRLENISIQDLAIIQNEAMKEQMTIEQFILKAISEYIRMKYESPKEEQEEKMENK